MKTRSRLIVLCSLAALTVVSETACAPATRATGAGAAATVPASHGIDLAGIDRSAAPGDDFFRYANGTWLKTTEIPADRSVWGVSGTLVELTARRTVDLITEASKTEGPAGSDARKIGDTYATFMDEAAIEAKGLQPLQPALGSLAAISDARALARALGGTLRADVDVLNNTNFYTANLFGLWVAQDLNDPGRYSPFLLQGGLGMPDRDYYLDASPRMEEIRTRYQVHIAAVLKLAGIAEGDAKAARIFELEHRIAKAHVSRVDSQDVLKGNNHWTRQNFIGRAPGLDWQAFFSAAGLDVQNEFVVWQPSAVTGIAALVRDQPLATWKDYLTFRAVERASSFLPKAFVDEQFAFYGKVLSGTPKLRDRWKRGVDVTDAALGEVVGKLYVARYFPPAEKARAEEMVRNEVAAFGRRIDGLDWMARETKIKAKAKLAALKVGILTDMRSGAMRDEIDGMMVVRAELSDRLDSLQQAMARANVRDFSQRIAAIRTMASAYGMIPVVCLCDLRPSPAVRPAAARPSLYFRTAPGCDRLPGARRRGQRSPARLDLDPPARVETIVSFRDPIPAAPRGGGCAASLF